MHVYMCLCLCVHLRVCVSEGARIPNHSHEGISLYNEIFVNYIDRRENSSADQSQLYSVTIIKLTAFLKQLKKQTNKKRQGKGQEVEARSRVLTMFYCYPHRWRRAEPAHIPPPPKKTRGTRKNASQMVRVGMWVGGERERRG